MDEAIPVMGFFVSREGVQAKVRGFVDLLTEDLGLQLATTHGAADSTSYFSVFLGRPVGAGCRFLYGDKRELPDAVREEWSGALGDTALTILLPYRARLTIFFTP